jgi:ABC-type taurine transport system ATPase subunit
VSETENIIEVRGLKNSFVAQTVHENLDLDVRRGEILGVVGGSGTGKSVLMGNPFPGGRALLDADRRRECAGADPGILSENRSAAAR